MRTGDLFKGTEFERAKNFCPLEEYRNILGKIDISGGLVINILSKSNCENTGDININKESSKALLEFFKKVSEFMEE